MKGAEWNEDISAFWYGGIELSIGQPVELIAWKGSNQIFIYPCDDHPHPPSGVLQYHRRIETLDDFEDAMKNGKRLTAKYEEVNNPTGESVIHEPSFDGI